MDLNCVVGAIRHCRRILAFGHGKAFHSHLIKFGFLKEVFIVNNLIAMYTDFRFLEDAQQLFDEAPKRNVVTWTTMISAFTYAGRPLEALRYFNWMSESGSEMLNSFTFSTALKACALLGSLELGKSIHGNIPKVTLDSDTVLMNTLLDMYVKCGRLCDAQKVFDGALSPNSNSWNTIIAGYSKEGRMVEALNLFQQMPEPNVVSWNTIIAGLTLKESVQALEFTSTMHRKGIRFDQFTFPCVLKVCGSLHLLTVGQQIHCYVVKSGFDSDCYTGSALVDMYAKCTRVDEATKFFDQYSRHEASVHDKLALWNSMLSGYVLNEHRDVALDLISKMHGSGAFLDSYTYSSVLKICIDLLNLSLGLQVHGLIVTSGYELDCVVGSVLIDFYAKLGDTMHALLLFQMLPKKDIIAWSGLIAGCVKEGSHFLAFSLFKDMFFSDIEVDQFVISSVLKACSDLAGFESGKQVHTYSIKSGYEMEGVIVTSLIDMYSKCGEIEASLKLFSGVSNRDTACWTGIIVGCGQNGKPEEAIQFFQDMLKSGAKPNEITFLGVLSACRHVGLVGEAWNFFRSMGVEHGLEPCLEHYSCMVDLLGRAGCFDEAEKLVLSMPYEPDHNIWLSLLGACGIHRNVELGKRIGRHLLAVSPEDPSVYVTLSNIYCCLGLWEESSKLRYAMKNLGTKEAGKSWIEVRS
ncbi:pentatricopeptide repeat-containing protein At4g08210 [Macadamia integrifolia]|uniref:pentatricopeptide repeat-containing protein At4g08210 n=1 Tax=Macadamia integrifolia TaxID=60698 RepID=UPI001C4E4934|nr:pentatricopeptide repeat-containing protein At4g08210 [Macadamia integrifolia]XP_042496609.1 pentatricopeptide repeat-containing protein At4g08210 [Macadamia integrifolia]XP_042496610.1 pentatricopeptide repeat-containing protein At4g08210 [Macadamia integrifolia]XP_042496611.1 pentatricopeptide repeat-containing protein At4g08210 [Macadamia integrifolia]XP_042496612.1 pentatricopeptide repeat-containing protein At4g08210 [Macadamia integrifolia]XP_042496613.1 pentatricopeptide repeat-conta